VRPKKEEKRKNTDLGEASRRIALLKRVEGGGIEKRKGLHKRKSGSQKNFFDGQELQVWKTNS